MATSWFGVKTLYRVTAEGRAKNKDEFYDANATLLEERIVLIEAEDIATAKLKADEDAEGYAEEVNFENPYGQQVSMTYLGQCEAYILLHDLEEGSEVFSSTEVIAKSVKDDTLLTRRFGVPAEEAGLASVRRKFCPKEIMEILD